MSEDTPVNTGVSWPSPLEADRLVRRMQVKLHHWAAADRGRRFHDLFNLVYDPAFSDRCLAAGQHKCRGADSRGRQGERVVHRQPGWGARVSALCPGRVKSGAFRPSRGRGCRQLHPTATTARR
jgi:hypothetical protein